ncbi:MAG: prolyl oligopeptidase family serine peptidase [Nocardioides sp.]
MTWASGLLAVVLVMAGCTSDGQAEGGQQPDPSASPSVSSPESETPTETPTQTPTPTPTEPAGTAPARPISVLGLAEQRHRGDRLRLGAVREQTDLYTSYDVTYRSRSTTGPEQDGEESYTISGVLNVPTGRGSFVAVVLAHGYIDPAVYVRGQGMTRERGYLAARGYIALHVDYRNHAESDNDPRYQTRMRLGYTADVIAAVKALRGSPDVPVDDDRIALFGRSMGGGVILKALVAEPGLVQAAAPASRCRRSRPTASGSSCPSRVTPGQEVVAAHGSPADSPDFWRENSSRPYFDRITEPVLMVHGRFDDTCPPPWAAGMQRALVKAGVNSQIEWYDDGHALGPAFNAAMDRTVTFFDTQLG